MSAKKDAKRQAHFKKRDAAATLKMLSRRFPACFLPVWAHKPPLALQIDKLIVSACPDLSRSEIKQAITYYTRGWLYLRYVVAGASRVDLQGHSVGLVSVAEAAHAARQMRALNLRFTARSAPLPSSHAKGHEAQP